MKPLLSAGKHSAGSNGWKNAILHSAGKYISSEKRGKNFHRLQGVGKYSNECNCKITCRRYPRAEQTVCFLALGNTAHRSTPLEAFSFKLYENCPVKFLDTVRFPLKEAHTNVKLHVKLHGTAWKGGRTALSVRKFGRLTVERSVWTKPRCWTVPCERSDRSNFSAGGKFVLCRVRLASV